MVIMQVQSSISHTPEGTNASSAHARRSSDLPRYHGNYGFS